MYLCMHICIYVYPPPSLWPRCGRVLALNLFLLYPDLESSKGPGHSLVALTRAPLLNVFFRHSLFYSWDCFFFRFWCQLGSNLPPNLVPKSTKNRPKRVPNSKPTCIIFSMPFLSILGTSWLDFLLVLAAKLKPKLTKKSIIWPLVGKLADIAKSRRKIVF